MLNCNTSYSFWCTKDIWLSLRQVCWFWNLTKWKFGNEFWNCIANVEKFTCAASSLNMMNEKELFIVVKKNQCIVGWGRKRSHLFCRFFIIHFYLILSAAFWDPAGSKNNSVQLKCVVKVLAIDSFDFGEVYTHHLFTISFIFGCISLIQRVHTFAFWQILMKIIIYADYKVLMLWC